MKECIIIALSLVLSSCSALPFAKIVEDVKEVEAVAEFVEHEIEKEKAAEAAIVPSPSS